jgi:RNA polymerase sigma-70 factor (sigma-E family)
MTEALAASVLLPETMVSSVPARLDSDEIVRLYTTHHTRLLRLATLVAPEDGMAEDLVQEAFVRLYRGWPRLRDPELVGAYLRTTVVNLAHSRRRRLATAWRHRTVPTAHTDSAEDVALQAERGNEVVEALRRLPARQRQCLVLRFYEGLTESEIARELGISVGSVRTHTSRAYLAVAARLEERP